MKESPFALSAQVSDLNAILQHHTHHLRIAYLNVNYVAGFKLLEVKSLILNGFFYVFVIAETKIDQAFPDSQF